MTKALTLQTIFSAVDRMTGPVRHMKKGVVDMNKVVDGLNKGINIVAGAAVVSLGLLAKKGLDLASDLTEVQNVVDTSFGAEGAGKVNAWANSALKAFGLSELQAKKFSGTMGAMLKSSGLAGDGMVAMATDLSALAGDFASFYNLDAQEAFDKIRSGISGETEPLKQLGINMSVANLEAFALTQGIKKRWAAMKQGEQIELRYAYLMQASADAQGDFAKTLATSYANQKRVLATNIEQVAARAMKSALPIMIEFSKRLNGVVEKIGAWVESNQDLIGQKMEAVFNGVAKGIEFITSPGTLSGLLSLAAGIKAVSIATSLMGAGNPWVLAIGAAVTLITLIVANWDKIEKFFGGMGGEGVYNGDNAAAGVSARSRNTAGPSQSSRAAVQGLAPVSSTSNSTLDVNFNNLPGGTSMRQTGSAPGITVNQGPTMGRSR